MIRAPAGCRFAIMRRAITTFVVREYIIRQICRSATLPWPSQPLELGQCWLQLRSNLSQLALHSPLSQPTMHCSCSSGSAHCALQAFAFVRQFVSQASASLSLCCPARERSPACDGAALAIMSAPKMQAVSRKDFMDAFSRGVLELYGTRSNLQCFDRFPTYHIGWPKGMSARYSRACLPQSKGRRERRAGDRDQGEGAKDKKGGCKGDHRTRPSSGRRDAEDQDRHAKRQNQHRE